jgi:phosphatidylserine/phosphatidylglycerophosphate/cardiolipin synthase-like enzyme
MAKFLNTSATNYFLEEIIKSAKDRLVLISPYLRVNERIKELLEDKNRLKIDVRLVYGKNDLQPTEMNWLKDLTYIRTSFCKNLHAKCYLNEETAIITSLNLYEFSQVNNNEMGVLISRHDDSDLYRDTWEEAQRIIRISEEVRISLEKVVNGSGMTEEAAPSSAPSGIGAEKLTPAKLAARLGLKTGEVTDRLAAGGYLENREGKTWLTAKGKAAGGEFRMGQYGPYFLWPTDSPAIPAIASSVPA